jgi:hypothetical protein
MTAKEKAEELIHFYTKELLSAKYSINGFVIEQLAKQCALIAVDVIIEVLWHTHKEINQQEYRYYLEVKQEIQNF